MTQATKRRRMRLRAIVGASLVFACAKSPVATEQAAAISARLAQAAAAVTGQEATLANEYEQGRYLGFDTNKYPGDDTMRAWRSAPGAPYSWVGYYLSSPCHRDSSWAGKRQSLRAMGWGVAVVYVGQQSWGREPHKLIPSALEKLQRKGVTCSADFLSAERGVADANDAIVAVEREGFGKGTVVYLDVERMEDIPAAMRDYYRAWVSRLLADGRFQPGIYTHKHNADLIYSDVKSLFVAAGYRDEPRVWIASARDFDPSKAPADVGHAYAGVWQGVIDVMKVVADLPLPIDINVSSWASPSEPGVATD